MKFNNHFRLIGLGAWALLAAGCMTTELAYLAEGERRAKGGAAAIPVTAAAAKATTLRQAAEARGFKIGSTGTTISCYWDGPVCNPMLDPQYTATLAREFNLIIPEGEQMWEHSHPQKDRFDFTKSDFIVDFAVKNGIEVHGHALVAHNQQPPWLKGKKFSKEEMSAIVKNHIFTVARHFRGRVQAWNVTNEALVCNTDIRPEVVEPPCRPGSGVVPRVWAVSQAMGPGYIEQAFRWARQADPDALLFYNDYNIEGFAASNWSKEKEDGTYRFIKRMVERKVPIDGVGFQLHLNIDGRWSKFEPTPQDFAANVRRYNKLGLQVRITEMDIGVKRPVSEERLKRQAAKFRKFLNVCLRAENCTAFATWGYTDKHSWINDVGRPDNVGSALLIDENYVKKHAYKEVLHALKYTPREP